MHSNPDNVSETPFDLTPMIDVVMLLIVFFMLSAQFAQSNLTPMDLPQVKGESAAADRAAAIVIDLAIDGSLRLHDESIAVDRLTQLVAADLKRDANAEIVVRADRGCSARHLNDLARVLTGIGAKRWRLATSAERVAEGG